jgi:calcineurin-like phosphoesterase family protein
MHEHMIQEWNAAVSDDDIVIHLGDYICGGTKEQVKAITEQLKGIKILITGNHDRKGKGFFMDCGFERVFKHRWIVGMYCFSHRPQEAQWLLDNEVRYNMHGHSHKWQYGDPFYNFGVDVVGYKPKAVKLNLTREDLLNGEGRCISDPYINYKHGKLRVD